MFSGTLKVGPTRRPLLFRSALPGSLASKRRPVNKPVPAAHVPVAWQPVLENTLLLALWNWFHERFTPAGHWLLLTTLVFACSGISSLELQFHVALLYAAMLWFLAWLAGWFCRPKAELQTRHAERIGAGETLQVDVEVQSAKNYAPGELAVLPFRWPLGLKALPETGQLLPRLMAGEQTRVVVEVECARRGVYSLPGWSLETDYPFGLLRTRRVFRCPQKLLVYPAFTPLLGIDLPLHNHSRDGLSVASHAGESSEFQGNRDYREGDRIRDIDWRATARLQRPFVREYCEERWPRAAVVLDTQLLKPLNEQEAANFERAVSLCAAVTEYMARERYVVELFAAGEHLLHLGSAHHATYLEAILDVLAGVEGNREQPFRALQAALEEHLGHLQVTVCMLLGWDEARQAFVHELQSHGALVKTVIVQHDLTKAAGATDDVLVIDRVAYEAGVQWL